MEARELANFICERLQLAGYEALLVGGCVRDLLLGRTPTDYDVATNARPDQVLELFPEAVAVGAQFGVILVVQGGLGVEVATYRADIGYSDGRHPDAVSFARTAREDVQRRDFTINGLLMRHDNGDVLDYVNGKRDLQQGIVRTIGDPELRFAEDKLRLMRAVRFAARFGFTIDPATCEAIQRQAREVAQVSAERVRDELTKLLTEGFARRGFELLEQTRLLAAVLPEVEAMKGVQQPPQFHPEGDVWIHTRLMLEQLPQNASATLAWGVLLHDVGKPPTFRSAEETGDRIRFDGHVDVGVRMTQDILGRLRFSNDDSEQIQALVANHMRFKDVEQMRASTLKRFLRLPRFHEHMELHRLDCLSSNRRLESYAFMSRLLEETPPEQIQPPRLLTGDDLKDMGYPPGPAFSQILRAIEDAQLEGQLTNADEAKAFVRHHFRRLRVAGPSPEA